MLQKISTVEKEVGFVQDYKYAAQYSKGSGRGEYLLTAIWNFCTSVASHKLQQSPEIQIPEKEGGINTVLYKTLGKKWLYLL